MSEFSERCRQLLINSGSNVYQMAKHSSLDKTSIQRMVTGKRLPSLDFVKEFCSYLRISPIEKKELLELYEIEKVGKSEYMSRCYIKSLIENLSFLDEDDTENISFSETLDYCETFPPMPNVESKILFVLQSELKMIENLSFLDEDDTENISFSETLDYCETFPPMPNVESKILFVLQSELKNDKNPEILFNLPTSYRYIFFILKGLFAEFEGEASVKHLITLNKNPLNTIYPCQNLEALSNIFRYIFFILKGLFAEFEGEASVKHLITLNKNPLNTIYPCQNLEALSNILPLSEILKNIYLPYYLYNNLTLGDEKMLIMPYYIITSKYLLTISSDFKTVSLHDSDTVIRVYRKEFYRIFNMAQPLIKYADNTFKIINHLQEAQPLIKYADNTFKIINHLQENYIEYGLPSHTLEFHPCLFFMDTSFALSKDSFKQIPHADEHIAALQEMYKVVSASTPPQKKIGGLQFLSFPSALSKDSFKQIPHADEHIAALQEMYKVVSASTPPQKKIGGLQFLSFPSWA